MALEGPRSADPSPAIRGPIAHLQSQKSEGEKRMAENKNAIAKRLRMRLISGNVKLDDSDKISKLPDTILLHILFFLPIEEAARLVVVSKTWLRVWNLLPVFQFCFDQFLSAFSQSEDQEGTHRFVTWVNSSLSLLQDHRAIIKSFSLKVDLSQENLTSQMDNWIILVMKNFVREINISIANGRYSIPQSILASKCLVKLHLEDCKFPDTLFIDIAEFNCLKELFLVKVAADNDQVQKLINCSRSLEKLTLCICPSMEYLLLDNFSKLNFVAVRVKILKIEAPNLHTLIIVGASQVYASDCVNVKKLGCIMGSLCFNANNLIQELVSRFPHLQMLRLYLSRNQRLRIQSCCLTSLHLRMKFEDPMELELDTPQLSDFYCSGKVVPSLRIMNTSTKQ